MDLLVDKTCPYCDRVVTHKIASHECDERMRDYCKKLECLQAEDRSRISMLEGVLRRIMNLSQETGVSFEDQAFYATGWAADALRMKFDGVTKTWKSPDKTL